MVFVDLFVSHFTHRLDSKGRVSIPAAFRAALARDGFDGLYALPSLDCPALDCGGNALLREIDGLMARLPPCSAERDAIATALLGTSEVLKVDTEGRVVLTEGLKAWTGIAVDATFVGHGHKFQIWEPERFRARLDEARNRARALREAMAAGRGAAFAAWPAGAPE